MTVRIFYTTSPVYAPSPVSWCLRCRGAIRSIGALESLVRRSSAPRRNLRPKPEQDCDLPRHLTVFLAAGLYWLLSPPSHPGSVLRIRSAGSASKGSAKRSRASSPDQTPATEILGGPSSMHKDPALGDWLRRLRSSFGSAKSPFGLRSLMTEDSLRAATLPLFGNGLCKLPATFHDSTVVTKLLVISLPLGGRP